VIFITAILLFFLKQTNGKNPVFAGKKAGNPPWATGGRPGTFMVQKHNIMNEQPMSIEEIDAHIAQQAKALNTKDFAGLDPCKIYKVARPILVFVKALLFFKPAWQAILQGLIDALDKLCP
jgi:hypothetical protein